jgi:hypothetical protein
MVALVVVTASAATAFEAAKIVSICTHPDSNCLNNIQRYIFKRFVSGWGAAGVLINARDLIDACDRRGIFVNPIDLAATPKLETFTSASDPVSYFSISESRITVVVNVVIVGCGHAWYYHNCCVPAPRWSRLGCTEFFEV